MTLIGAELRTVTSKRSFGGVSNEGSRFSEKNVRQVQGDSSQRRGAGDLRQP